MSNFTLGLIAGALLCIAVKLSEIARLLEQLVKR